MSVWEDVGRAGLGVSTGGLSELAIRSGMVPDPWGPGPGRTEQSLLETPAKSAARTALLNFMNSGTLGGFTAGKAYDQPLGNYQMTGIEGQGQDSLSSLLRSGMPAVMGYGSDEIKKLLTTDSYDPNNDHGVYAGLTGGIDRNVADAQAGAKRAGSYMGNLYSTDAINKQGDIAAQGAINKNGILANLYQNFSNQKLSVIPQALAYGQGQESIDQSRIAQSQQYGGLERILKNQDLQDKYSEFKRQREELKLPIAAANTILGGNENYTIPGVQNPNPWAKILDTLVQGGATVAGHALAA